MKREGLRQGAIGEEADDVTGAVWPVFVRRMRVSVCWWDTAGDFLIHTAWSCQEDKAAVFWY